MSEQIFTDVPQVELLQWLARGSLKQNLPRALRLWVWLRSLYGDSQDRILLDDGFSLAQWRDTFFTLTHPKGEAVPPLHNRSCPCAKTTAEWLFNQKTGLERSQWLESVQAHTPVPDLEKLLEQRLFGVTRRSLQADLDILAELGWLEKHQQKYYRIKYFPARPTTTKLHAHELNFLNQEDLVAIAQNLSQEICGVRRFFFKLDFVVTATDEIENWQHELQRLWAKTPVPPIQITYNSARLKNIFLCTVYPVCIYYVQRAVYLCAFGESPDLKTDWYNFRLDRIENINPIEWTHRDIPKNLIQRYHQRNLPTPDEIEMQMSLAWGFDFYLQSRLMLLRFDRDYHDRYIRRTFRHDTFKAIAYAQVKNLIKKHTPNPEQQEQLLKILAHRSPDDAYYRVQYRHGDHNVIMRLRAWRPKVEVFLPWDMRQNIARDVAREFLIYNS
ncbi:TIGR03985 family CRISPR-associated protein [Aliinostoc sp. HNIBRCY26]|uniref:TIGR03985 family CRISPR-associated protein n=1 Tax=Aliinostoc sp. HNIBRCY26 TaxID=3418997 RepID=UPI003D03FBB6